MREVISVVLTVEGMEQREWPTIRSFDRKEGDHLPEI
jgi:hypothetical protein